MRKSTRLAALAASVILAGTAVAGTATAQEAEVELADKAVFEGRATADALTISLFGQTITSSAVTAEVKPDFAKATVSETLLGPIRDAEVFTAEQPGGEAEAKPEACTGSDLTAIPGVNRFDVTCGVATARAGANDGAARALGAEVVLQPSVSQVLETLQIQDPATEGANALLDGLNENLVQPLTGNPLGDLVEDGVVTVQEVVNRVLGFQSTARVVIAPALAQVDATECSVASRAHAQGVRVELLPVDEVGATNGLLPDDLEAGEPLVVITLGNAKDSLTVPRCGGEPVRETTSAFACVTLGSVALTESLGLAQETCLEGGQTVCVLEGTPLESCVSLAAAGADGGADAGSVQLFKGVNGGVDLATGRAAAEGGNNPPAQAAAAPAGELPRTGGPAALPVLGGALLAAAAVIRRFARSA